MGSPPDNFDDDAFAEWVGPHLAVLTAIAAREVGAAHAEDLVQETLVRAWSRRETYRAEAGSTRAWLVAILLDRGRRFRVRSLRPPPRIETGAVAETDSIDERLRVEQAIRQLPRRQRQAVTLFYLADLPISDVAAALRISTAAVKVHLHAARGTLRNTLESR